MSSSISTFAQLTFWLTARFASSVQEERHAGDDQRSGERKGKQHGRHSHERRMPSEQIWHARRCARRATGVVSPDAVLLARRFQEGMGRLGKKKNCQDGGEATPAPAPRKKAQIKNG